MYSKVDLLALAVKLIFLIATYSKAGLIFLSLLAVRLAVSLLFAVRSDPHVAALPIVQ